MAPPAQYSGRNYRQNEHLVYGGVDFGLERPRYFFRPAECWEMKGADITLSPVHAAARGEVGTATASVTSGAVAGTQRGLSVRFPRFIRRRFDKSSEDATTAQEILRMYYAQGQAQGSGGGTGGRGNSKKGSTAMDDDGGDGDDCEFL